MSQRISIAISQLKAIEANQSLAERTIGDLGITGQTARNLTVRMMFGLTAVLAVFLVIASLPRFATARTLESIKNAIAGKIMHTRVFVLDDGSERLISERWTDGVRRRNNDLSHTTVSDGSVTIKLNHQYRTADVTNDPGYKYAPIGFDIDSILADMTGRDRSGTVKIETLSVKGVEKLVVEFRGRIADYTIQCDPITRLPETMIIVPTSSLSADKSPVMLRFDYIADAGDLFTTSVPGGYKVYDLRQGFESYTKSSLIDIADPKFKLFSLDINDRGEIFALCASNVKFEIDLGIEEPYAGPIRLESLDRARQPKFDKLRGHFLSWATLTPTNVELNLTLRLEGKVAMTKRLRPQRVDGRPGYYSLASHILSDRVDVPLDELHAALKGVRQVLAGREDGLLVRATFDPVTSKLKGTVHNTTTKLREDVGIVFKLLGSGPWASAKVVRVGDVGPGGTVEFSEKLASRRPGGPIPLVDVAFASLYDPSVGIRISPYRRH